MRSIRSKTNLKSQMSSPAGTSRDVADQPLQQKVQFSSKTTLQRIGATDTPSSLNTDGYGAWDKIRDIVINPFTEIIDKLNFTIKDDKDLKNVTRQNLIWCVKRLKFLKHEEKQIAAMRKKFFQMQGPKLMDLVDIVATKSGNFADSTEHAFAGYITNEFVKDQVDVEAIRKHNKRKASLKAITFSVTNLVKLYGVQEDKWENLQDMLDHLAWTVNVFKLDELSSGRVLSCATHAIFNKRDLLDRCKISHAVFAKFIATAEKHYHKSLTYHNAVHAADVVIGANVMLSLPAVREQVTDFEVLATLIAAALHDIDHLGVSTNFLINTHHNLADLYLDEAINENHHYNSACKVLRMEGCDITGNMDVKTRRRFYLMMKKIILGTDATKHEAHLGTLTAIKKSDFVISADVSERIKFFACVVRLCDLGNATKPFDIYQEWIERMSTEFFRQGQMEAELGLEISPMCDEKTTDFMACQIGLIDLIVSPLWLVWADIVRPHAVGIIDNMNSNREKIKALVQTTGQSNSAEQKPITPMDHLVMLTPKEKISDAILDLSVI